MDGRADRSEVGLRAKDQTKGGREERDHAEYRRASEEENGENREEREKEKHAGKNE
jgi:hypothetical protein